LPRLALNTILLISASWLTRILGSSHWCMACFKRLSYISSLVWIWIS
jgi:hypothetical protein